jgi:hypothetical protein
MESSLDAVSDVYGLLHENTNFTLGHLAIHGLPVERKTTVGKHMSAVFFLILLYGFQQLIQ